MIQFRPLAISKKAVYDKILASAVHRGCEYNFTNLYLWGQQRYAMVNGFMVLFSQFSEKSVYPYPVGEGDPKAALDAIRQDAAGRGIVCTLTCMSAEDCETLERLYPGEFDIRADRDSYDYVYNIGDLAELRGKRLQKKRNHLNNFMRIHPRCRIYPLNDGSTQSIREMLDRWYARKFREGEADRDLHLEQAAVSRALQHRKTLDMEGIFLEDNGEILAMTLGSFLSRDTFDVQFEKALPDVEGAYTAVNQMFAKTLREKYPDLRYLNREDDLGAPGLRQAKLSYYPAFFNEKYCAVPKDRE